MPTCMVVRRDLEEAEHRMLSAVPVASRIIAKKNESEWSSRSMFQCIL